jgi:FkbM family methyltransferase
MNQVKANFLHKIVSKLYRGKRQCVTAPADVERAEYCFYINYLRPGMIVFDVGANVGGLTVLFHKFVSLGGSVHAFECNAGTFKRLELVMKAFCGAEESSIFLNPTALSETAEARCLYEYPYGNASWTTLANRHILLPSGERAEPIQRTIVTSTLDKYCELKSVSHIDLLKLDVEGAELAVLRGAVNLLAAHRIKCIAFEFGQTLFDMGNEPGEILDLLENHGYRTKNLITADPLFPGGETRETAAFSMHVSTPIT